MQSTRKSLNRRKPPFGYLQASFKVTKTSNFLEIWQKQIHPHKRNVLIKLRYDDYAMKSTHYINRNRTQTIMIFQCLLSPALKQSKNLI